MSFFIFYYCVFSLFSVFYVILCFWYCMLLLSFELYAIVSIVLAFILVCNLADVCDFNLATMLTCGYTLPFVAIWAFFTLNGLFQTGHHFATFSGVLIVWCVCCRISSQLCSLSQLQFCVIVYLVSSSATLYTFSYTYHACVLYCLDVCITCHVFKVSAFVSPQLFVSMLFGVNDVICTMCCVNSRHFYHMLICVFCFICVV